MAYTNATALTQVRSRLNEATAAFWSDAELAAWIAEGVVDLGTKGLLIEDTQTVTLATDQFVYTTSDESWLANILKIYGCYHTDANGKANGLIKARPKMIGHLDANAAGRPKYYWIFNKDFYVWPQPSSTYNADDITVLHVKVSDDIADLNYEYQHLPIIYATATAKTKDRKHAEAQLLYTQYYNSTNFERDDKYEREVDAYDEFKIPRSSGGAVQKGQG